MSIETIKSALPEYAKDIKLNLGTLAADETLSTQQLWGSFVVAALASRQPMVIAAVVHDASTHLSAEAMNAAKAAAAVMGMNNIYYRFVHLASNETYGTLPAKLRMNIIANPGVDKADFELWSLVASAVNGCGLCIDSHEQHLLKAGMTTDQIQTAVRVAAVVHAASAVLDGESALGSVSVREAA
jgi:lipoyl-dependent peroxiredoxin subunit D